MTAVGDGRCTLKAAVRRFEHDCAVQALERTRGDKRAAAALLGISIASFYRKLTLPPAAARAVKSQPSGPGPEAPVAGGTAV